MKQGRGVANHMDHMALMVAVKTLKVAWTMLKMGWNESLI
jgi:hypothetical protein